MNDPRHQKLAQVLVHYSLKIKAGDKVAIWAPILAAPLARAVYREALHAGAHPAVRLMLGNNPGSFAFDGLTELKLSEGSLDQIRFIDLDLHEIEYYDALLYICVRCHSYWLEDTIFRPLCSQLLAKLCLDYWHRTNL